MAFNPFKYVDELREAGVPDKQAEAQIKVLSAVMESELATKHDIELVKHDIELVKKDIKELDTKLSRDIKELETKLSRDIKELEIKFSGEIRDSQHSIIWKLTGIFTALLTIFRFLPEFLKTAQ